RAHDCSGRASRRARILSRPLAEEAPSQAAPDPAGVRRAARLEDEARRLRAYLHRLGGIRPADAGGALRRAGAPEHGVRLRDPAGGPAGDQVRAPRPRARPPRLGSGVQKNLTTPPAAPAPLLMPGGERTCGPRAERRASLSPPLLRRGGAKRRGGEPVRLTLRRAGTTAANR